MSVVLRAEGVAKSYENHAVIADITLSVAEGELVSIVGASGVGKTTLFHILSGLLAPDAGRVFLRDKDTSGIPGQISYMLQKDLLLPHKKVIDNVSLPLRIAGAQKQEARAKAASYFARFGLGGTEYHYPAQLSGGMRQRAALLRTYLGSQGVSLLDEPFSALDALTKRDMHRWYGEVMSDIGLTTLFITHDIEEAVFLSDRIYVMAGKPGRIVRELRVTEAKPRDAAFTLSAAFTDYKREILAHLTGGCGATPCE